MRVYWLDGLIGLAVACVELAEGVGGAPVARELPRRRGRTRRSPARGDLVAAASPLSSAWRHGPGPTGFSTGRSRRKRTHERRSGHPIKQRRRPERAPVHVGIAEARRPRRGDRASRTPCAGRTRSADRARAVRASSDRASPWRRSTPRRSPCIARRRCSTARCAINRSGMRKASTSTKSGQRRQPEHGPLHRPQRRLMDVDAIDLVATRRRRPTSDTAALSDLLVETLALERASSSSSRRHGPRSDPDRGPPPPRPPDRPGIRARLRPRPRPRLNPSRRMAFSIVRKARTLTTARRLSRLRLP